MSIPLDLTHLNANSESEDSNYKNFEDDSDDDFGIPTDHQPSRPMVNIPNDVENELDYEIGWEWIEEDTGRHWFLSMSFGSSQEINHKASLMKCLMQGCTQ